MKTTAIIPAYNEEQRIGEVLEAVKNSRLVDEIIVVDDGSVDKTAEVAKRMGVKVIINDKNLGKGGALCRGLKDCQSDVILFLDADLCGFKPEDADRLLQPVLSGEWDMTIGIFQRTPGYRPGPEGCSLFIGTEGNMKANTAGYRRAGNQPLRRGGGADPLREKAQHTDKRNTAGGRFPRHEGGKAGYHKGICRKAKDVPGYR